MSLGTYGELKTAVSNWLHRDDLTTIVPDLIVLAEGRLNRKLRMRQQLTAWAGATVSGVQSVALPTDWLAFKRLRLASPDRALEFLSLEQWQAKYMVAEGGSPTDYSIQGSTIVLGPKPDAIYTLDGMYFAKIPTLTDAVATNWLLTAHPSLYLFAALGEASAFVESDVRVTMWEQKYAADLADAMAADEMDTHSGPLRVRPR